MIATRPGAGVSWQISRPGRVGLASRRVGGRSAIVMQGSTPAQGFQHDKGHLISPLPLSQQQVTTSSRARAPRRTGSGPGCRRSCSRRLPRRRSTTIGSRRLTFCSPHSSYNARPPARLPCWQRQSTGRPTIAFLLPVLQACLRPAGHRQQITAQKLRQFGKALHALSRLSLASSNPVS